MFTHEMQRESKATLGIAIFRDAFGHFGFRVKLRFLIKNIKNWWCDRKQLWLTGVSEILNKNKPQKSPNKIVLAFTMFLCTHPLLFPSNGSWIIENWIRYIAYTNLKVKFKFLLHTIPRNISLKYFLTNPSISIPIHTIYFFISYYDVKISLR